MLDPTDPNHFVLPLPEGAWADLYEAKAMPERVRRPIQRTALAMGRTMPEQTKTTIEAAVAPAGEAVPAMGAPPVAELVAEAAVDGATMVARLSDISDESLEAIDAYNDAVILGFVREWSYGEVKEAVLLEIPGESFDALITECTRRNKGGQSVGSAPESPDGADPTLPSGA